MIDPSEVDRVPDRAICSTRLRAGKNSADSMFRELSENPTPPFPDIISGSSTTRGRDSS